MQKVQKKVQEVKGKVQEIYEKVKRSARERKGKRRC